MWIPVSNELPCYKYLVHRSWLIALMEWIRNKYAHFQNLFRPKTKNPNNQTEMYPKWEEQNQRQSKIICFQSGFNNLPVFKRIKASAGLFYFSSKRSLSALLVRSCISSRRCWSQLLTISPSRLFVFCISKPRIVHCWTVHPKKPLQIWMEFTTSTWICFGFFPLSQYLSISHLYPADRADTLRLV